MVNACLRQLQISLRGEEVGALRIASTMFSILEEWSPGLVEQINLTKFAALIPNAQPPDLRPYMGMFHQEMGDVTHPASRPIAEGEKRLSSHVFCLFNQHPENNALCLGEDTRS